MDTTVYGVFHTSKSYLSCEFPSGRNEQKNTDYRNTGRSGKADIERNAYKSNIHIG